MRKSRFTEEQMVTILREAEKTSVAAAAKQNKVSEQSIYSWRKHFNGMEPSDIKKLKALEVRVGCGCTQAMMRSARIVPIKWDGQ